MKLMFGHIHPAIVMKSLRKMKELRILWASGCCNNVDDVSEKWEFDEGVQYLPDTLRSLHWSFYPISCLPKTFQANNLVDIEMNGSYISQLWEGGERKLTSLNFNGCSRFEYVGVSIHQNSLAMLELIVEPHGICPLHPNSNLPKFKLQCKYGEVLPLSGGNIEKLISFGLCACANLESFSASICGLQHLTALTLEGCIPELPMDLGGLECLEELHLTDCISLRDIPDSICKMKFLKNLHLPYCIQVEKLPEELGRLECLNLLDIEGAGISRLPESIFQLKDLCIIGSTWRLESYGLTSVTERSKNIAFCYIGHYFDLNFK
ncbi:hypothetical protein E3N88_09827 [Mikania micrantha]|uniref:Uncharacterized protein n=1 Tax=Mikania micrantha TaxID=192012 RepID=A0A5N6PM67_9ASTR|nr:hypothetical protein E3N88_09827 [Mikania micrantha]